MQFQTFDSVLPILTRRRSIMLVVVGVNITISHLLLPVGPVKIDIGLTVKHSCLCHSSVQRQDDQPCHKT